MKRTNERMNGIEWTGLMHESEFFVCQSNQQNPLPKFCRGRKQPSSSQEGTSVPSGHEELGSHASSRIGDFIGEKKSGLSNQTFLSLEEKLPEESLDFPSPRAGSDIVEQGDSVAYFFLLIL